MQHALHRVSLYGAQKTHVPRLLGCRAVQIVIAELDFGSSRQSVRRSGNGPVGTQPAPKLTANIAKAKDRRAGGRVQFSQLFRPIEECVAA